MCARKEKGIVLTETKGFSSTYSAFKKNASAFDLKRKGVSLQTQVRFGWNARAFFSRTKTKGSVLRIAVSLKITS